MRALVADRSATQRRVVLRALRAVGIQESLEYAEPRAAVPALEGNPEIVVIEWHPADDEALGFIADLRAREGGDRTVVIVLSERDRREDIERALAAGIQGYVLKPYEARVLIEQLAAAIQAMPAAAPDEDTAAAA